jgi:hypothetical protein
MQSAILEPSKTFYYIKRKHPGMLIRGVIVLHDNAHPHCPRHAALHALEGAGQSPKQPSPATVTSMCSPTQECAKGP